MTRILVPVPPVEGSPQGVCHPPDRGPKVRLVLGFLPIHIEPSVLLHGFHESFLSFSPNRQLLPFLILGIGLRIPDHLCIRTFPWMIPFFLSSPDTFLTLGGSRLARLLER